MKTHVFWLAAIILTGCGRENSREVTEQKQRGYPPLSESPLPPPPPPGHSVAAKTAARRLNAANCGRVPAEIADFTGLKGEMEKMNLIRDLRDYAAQAKTNNPFALTEKEIDAISQLENPIFH